MVCVWGVKCVLLQIGAEPRPESRNRRPSRDATMTERKAETTREQERVRDRSQTTTNGLGAPTSQLPTISMALWQPVNLLDILVRTRIQAAGSFNRIQVSHKFTHGRVSDNRGSFWRSKEGVPGPWIWGENQISLALPNDVDQCCGQLIRG